MLKVCVIGMWHLGCVTSACLSKWHSVVGCDYDGKIIEDLEVGKPPIFEPGLEQAMKEGRESKRLRFSSDVSGSVREADVIYLAFDTPVDDNDISDLSPIFLAVKDIAEVIENGQTLVVSSQVPVGTCRKIIGMLRERGKMNGIAYVPENLRLGNAIESFLSPERIVIGYSDERAKKVANELFGELGGKRLEVCLESAEMAKHAINTYLALLITFSGEISDLCEKTGADSKEVMGALLTENRVSPKAPLMPGLGFGGGTLARDAQSLREIGKECGIKTSVLDATIEANNGRKEYVKKRLMGLFGDLRGKTVAFFGLTYKPNTDTLRRSLALEIMGSLAKEGMKVRAYDPAIKKLENTDVFASPYECAEGADAIVIATAWDEFGALDYGRIVKGMRSPVIFDTKGILDRKKLPNGVKYLRVGVSDV